MTYFLSRENRESSKVTGILFSPRESTKMLPPDAQTLRFHFTEFITAGASQAKTLRVSVVAFVSFSTIIVGPDVTCSFGGFADRCHFQGRMASASTVSSPTNFAKPLSCKRTARKG